MHVVKAMCCACDTNHTWLSKHTLPNAPASAEQLGNVVNLRTRGKHHSITASQRKTNSVAADNNGTNSRKTYLQKTAESERDRLEEGCDEHFSLGRDIRTHARIVTVSIRSGCTICIARKQ